LGKHNGSLGTSGSVAWMFERKGYMEIELPTDAGKEIDEDSLMEIAVRSDRFKGCCVALVSDRFFPSSRLARRTSRCVWAWRR
jgi:hypothetical protein